ncbi:MarR family EPS-associated transcriptional regulator [Thiohalocapsa marina]|uniref:MarR family EPS-associated transcriptional regulator n=1 Tax=Thiohalocapsa marina TaxID=424902 RepID=A0A5M8FHL8_9GAMM|nr:MarR family EPS-associated transcriptional regulator [Thiohalocapsa marina]KAA6183914.1 MarR family EPS-associated transcriptional regulator [Thiohalocapsa marina]
MIKDEHQYRLLRHLEQHPGASQRELAKLVGLSLSSTNYCLRAVIEKGWVKMENFTRSKTKQRYLYLLTPEGAQAKLRVLNALIAQKRQEHAELQAFIEQLTREQQAQTQSPAKDPLPQQR